MLTLRSQLNERAFSVDNFLTANECLDLIALAHKSGFEAAQVRTSLGQRPMPLIRNNERVVVDGGGWISVLWQRLLNTELPLLEGQSPIGLPKDLRFYKYSPGQRFRMHKDGPWVEGGLTSKLTLLVYLNEGYAGGDTNFRDVVVKPAVGKALLFIHDTWHEGAQITEGTKYVLRSDVLYG